MRGGRLVWSVPWKDRTLRLTRSAQSLRPSAPPTLNLTRVELRSSVCPCTGAGHQLTVDSLLLCVCASKCCHQAGAQLSLFTQQGPASFQKGNRRHHTSVLIDLSPWLDAYLDACYTLAPCLPNTPPPSSPRPRWLA